MGVGGAVGGVSNGRGGVSSGRGGVSSGKGCISIQGNYKCRLKKGGRGE